MFKAQWGLVPGAWGKSSVIDLTIKGDFWVHVLSCFVAVCTMKCYKYFREKQNEESVYNTQS